jgi:outer membrane protein OmpA-like peptidoglycan-associated protein
MNNFRFHIMVLLAFSLLAANRAYGQNLLLNGNFEHPFIDAEYQWRQPHGAYYHYYQDVRKNGSASDGQFYNGLCMYNHQENEFMQARLSEPLMAGQTYCLKIMVRLMDVKAFNHELHDKIGILFSAHPFAVEKPYYPGGDPDLYWLIPDSVNRMEWMALDTSYIASGHEQYITIGYWRSLGYSEKVNNEEFERYMGLMEPTGIAAEIPPPDFSAKSKKKRSKKGKDEWADFRAEVMQKAHSKGEVIPTASPGEGLFTLRYYMDQVCVAPKSAEGVCDCTIGQPEVDLQPGALVRMDNLLFASGEATLEPVSDYALEILALIMTGNPEMRIAIHGHTDNVGSDADNLKLSEDRAIAVYNYLIDAGISKERLSAQGYGSTRPVSDNSSQQGRAKNRRVEFEVLD